MIWPRLTDLAAANRLHSSYNVNSLAQFVSHILSGVNLRKVQFDKEFVTISFGDQRTPTFGLASNSFPGSQPFSLPQCFDSAFEGSVDRTGS